MSQPPGPSAMGSGVDDGAWGSVLGRGGFGVLWGLGRPLVAGLLRQGALQAKGRQQVVLRPSRGTECSPPRQRRGIASFSGGCAVWWCAGGVQAMLWHWRVAWCC